MIRILIVFTISICILFSCKTKCSTCPGMKPNKYQKEAKKMEKKMDKAEKKNRK